MLPYFYQFETELLDRAARDSVLAIAERYQGGFEEYRSHYTDKTDNNNFLRPRSMPTLFADTGPSVKELFDSVALPHYPVILLHRPGKAVPRHVDDNNHRNAVISIPLAPKDDYPPTYYWESNDSAEPIATARFVDGNPCLLNTQKIHSLVNTAKVNRYNLQICFNEPFDAIVGHMMAGTLFKK